MRRISSVAIALLVLAGPVPLAWASEPAPIAFTRYGDLFSIRPGGGVRRVTDTPALEHRPAWSRDHRRLAFVTWDRRLVTLDLRTGVRRRVVRVGGRYDGIEAVAWAPDGTRIAFATSREFRREGTRILCGQIWTVAPDGGALTKVLRGQELVTGVGWMPTGDRIVASTEWPNGVDACREGVRTGIVTMAPDGSRRSWTSERVTASQVDVSDDGRWFVYRGWLRTCHACGEIWLQRAREGRARLIAMPPEGAAGMMQPRFSPSGRRIAMLVWGSPARIWVMRADGSRLHRLAGRADDIDW